jgi:hypothetical protein
MSISIQMTAQAFGAQLLSLQQIFEGRLFTIPDYQRGYAWDEKQVQELLNDIDHLLSNKASHRHYTGTLVLSRPLGADENEYHVVDGQQRLTTLVTLLSTIAPAVEDENRAVFVATYLRRGEPGSDRSVLKLNSDTRLFYERAVLGNDAPQNQAITHQAHERLFQSKKIITAWLSSRMSSGLLVQDLRNTVESELGFLVYAPKEDAETGIMFEVINNRGKPLSELEKVKNYLIYCCVKVSALSLRADIDRDWSTVLRHLNTAKKNSAGDEGAFLRYCMIVHFGLNKTDSQYGYDILKARLGIDDAIRDPLKKSELIEKIADFVRFIVAAALWYARLYGAQTEGLRAPLKEVLDQLRGQGRHASIMPLFLALVIKSDGEGESLIRQLKLLEIVNFRVYMARKITQRNDSGQGELYAYAAAYFQRRLLEWVPQEHQNAKRDAITDEDRALEYCLVGFVIKYAPDILFEKSFQLEAGSSDDFYAWGGLRYFLMSYEQRLHDHKTTRIDRIGATRIDGGSSDYLSVEHLWATDYRTGDGENNRAIDGFEKRRLGNFVLLELRLNIQGSNESIEDKIHRYRFGMEGKAATDLEHVREAARTAKKVLESMSEWKRSKNYYLDLHRDINSMQEGRYTKFALDRWAVKGYAGFKAISKAVAIEMETEEE